MKIEVTKDLNVYVSCVKCGRKLLASGAVSGIRLNIVVTPCEHCIATAIEDEKYGPEVMVENSGDRFEEWGGTK